MAKNPPAKAGDVRDTGSILGLGRSPGEEKCSPLQYSGLQNSMDSTAHGAAKSRTRLNDFHLLTQRNPKKIFAFTEKVRKVKIPFHSIDFAAMEPLQRQSTSS